MLGNAIRTFFGASVARPVPVKAKANKQESIRIAQVIEKDRPYFRVSICAFLLFPAKLPLLPLVLFYCQLNLQPVLLAK